MGRPPLETKLRQIPVALSADSRARLEEAAANAGHSLAEEIRRRLERTFVEDATDQPTRDLMLTFDDLNRLVAAQTGYSWYTHPGAWSVLRAAILARLDRLQPVEPL